MKEKIRLLGINELKPGEMTCITVASQAILVANVDGEFYASDEMCTHEDWPLSNGALKGDCVECPLHGSRFNLKTGQPLDEPATVALRIYPTSIEQDTVFIEL